MASVKEKTDQFAAMLSNQKKYGLDASVLSIQRKDMCSLIKLMWRALDLDGIPDIYQKGMANEVEWKVRTRDNCLIHQEAWEGTITFGMFVKVVNIQWGDTNTYFSMQVGSEYVRPIPSTIRDLWKWVCECFYHPATVVNGPSHPGTSDRTEIDKINDILKQLQERVKQVQDRLYLVEERVDGRY